LVSLSGRQLNYCGSKNTLINDVEHILCMLHTVICRVVNTEAVKSIGSEPRHQLARAALVHALTLSQGVQLVKHLEKSSTGLVDRANDRSAAATQVFQQFNALVT
jgi:hypothetical protein